jgi:cysteine synthase
MKAARFIPEDGCYFQRMASTPPVPVQFDSEQPEIWRKLEFLNPSGSSKDRISRYMLEKAWRRGDVGRGAGW